MDIQIGDRIHHLKIKDFDGIIVARHPENKQFWLVERVINVSPPSYINTEYPDYICFNRLRYYWLWEKDLAGGWISNKVYSNIWEHRDQNGVYFYNEEKPHVPWDRLSQALIVEILYFIQIPY